VLRLVPSNSMNDWDGTHVSVGDWSHSSVYFSSNLR